MILFNWRNGKAVQRFSNLKVWKRQQSFLELEMFLLVPQDLESNQIKN